MDRIQWKKVKLGDYIDVLSGFAYKSKDFRAQKGKSHLCA